MIIHCCSSYSLLTQIQRRRGRKHVSVEHMVHCVCYLVPHHTNANRLSHNARRCQAGRVNVTRKRTATHSELPPAARPLNASASDPKPQSAGIDIHKFSRLSLNGLRCHFDAARVCKKARAAAAPPQPTTATAAQQHSTNDASAFAPHREGTPGHPCLCRSHHWQRCAVGWAAVCDDRGA